MSKIIAGNWKMNAGRKEAKELLKFFSSSAQAGDNVIIFPQAPLLADSIYNTREGVLRIGAQSVSHNQKGAYTGQVSADLVKELGCEYVLAGHSERREYCAESSILVAQQAKYAYSIGLKPIICVGESEDIYNSGNAKEFLAKQIAESVPSDIKCLVAYEPIWAIGTGKTPTSQQIDDICGFVAQETSQPVLYGGSVNGANCEEILSLKNVDGVLVGGASLKQEDFQKIIIAGREAL